MNNELQFLHSLPIAFQLYIKVTHISAVILICVFDSFELIIDLLRIWLLFIIEIIFPFYKIDKSIFVIDGKQVLIRMLNAFFQYTHGQ